MVRCGGLRTRGEGPWKIYPAALWLYLATGVQNEDRPTTALDLTNTNFGTPTPTSVLLRRLSASGANERHSIHSVA